MAVTNLRETLSRLHEQLASTPSVDDDSRRLLKEVAADIERLVHRGESVQAGGSGEEHRSRLEELAVRFEADHPSLAGSVRQILDVLGRAGL